MKGVSQSASEFLGQFYTFRQFALYQPELRKPLFFYLAFLQPFHKMLQLFPVSPSVPKGTSGRTGQWFGTPEKESCEPQKWRKSIGNWLCAESLS